MTTDYLERVQRFVHDHDLLRRFLSRCLYGPPGHQRGRLRRALMGLAFGHPRNRPGSLPLMTIQRGRDGRRRSHHAPLENPTWLPAGQSDHVRSDDPVLGFELDGQTWALPWWIMKNHHVANLVLGGRPVMVVLCEVCAGAAAFDAILGGKRHAFRVEGKYNGTHILLDEETKSLWTPTGGEAIHGPLLGTRLQRLPLYQCTWSEWTALHPACLVLNGAGERRAGHGSEFPHPDVRWTLTFPRLRYDPGVDDSELVLGVEAGGRYRAYPLARLHRLGPVLNDTLGGCDIVIFTKPGSWLSIAFGRWVDGRTLVFQPRTDEPSFEDVETGTRWNITGTATAGALVGRVLPFVPSGIEKWYVWSSRCAATDVWDG